jgi:hypothetical protein
MVQAKASAFQWETEAHCNEERLKKTDDAHGQVSILLAKTQLAQSVLLKRAQTIIRLKKLASIFSSWCRYGSIHKEKQVVNEIFVLKA